jgi:hypothetical protein
MEEQHGRIRGGIVVAVISRVGALGADLRDCAVVVVYLRPDLFGRG